MKIPTLDKLLEDQLKDIYNAENQLLKALPRLAKAASGTGLKAAITTHLEETRGQVERLDKVGKLLGIKLTGKKCAAMEGLVEEGKEVLEMEAPDGIIDLAIIAASQRVEHYEISAYGSARALAEQLGQDQVAKILQQTLDEESATDEKLTAIAADEAFPNAKSEAEEGEADEDEEPASKRKKTTVKSSGR